MSLFKTLIIIASIWLIIKVKHFISGIRITSEKSLRQQDKKDRKRDLDIQDADYEDVE